MKYGFLNKKGKLVIPLKYDEVEDFSDERAMVYGKGGWQAINPKGKVVFGDSIMIIEMQHTNSDGYYDVEPPSVHSGRMLTRNNGKYGYTDRNGKIIISYHYDIAMDFSNGRALVAMETPPDTSAFQIKKHYKNHFVKSLDSLFQTLPGKLPPKRQWMIIDQAGQVVYRFKKDERPDWREGISDGMTGFYNGRKKGFINHRGKVVVPAIYGNSPYPLPYSDGVCIIQIRGQKSNNSDGYMKIVDTTGKVISKIPFKTKYGLMYNSNLKYHEGLLAVKILTVPNTTFGLWGYMDKQGNLVIKPQFNKALDFHDGRAIVVTAKGKLGVIKNPLGEKQ